MKPHTVTRTIYLDFFWPQMPRLTMKSWGNFWSLASVHCLHIITLRTAEYFPTLSPGNTTLLIFGLPDFCNSFCQGYFIHARSVISPLGLFEDKIYFLFSTHGHNRLYFPENCAPPVSEARHCVFWSVRQLRRDTPIRENSGRFRDSKFLVLNSFIEMFLYIGFQDLWTTVSEGTSRFPHLTDIVILSPWKSSPVTHFMAIGEKETVKCSPKHSKSFPLARFPKRSQKCSPSCCWRLSEATITVRDLTSLLW